MFTDFLSLIKTIFFDWFEPDYAVRIAEGLLSDDEFRKERIKSFLKGWLWLFAIGVPFILTGIAVFMKTAFVWKILLFIPSFALLVFFIRLWWRTLNGE